MAEQIQWFNKHHRHTPYLIDQNGTLSFAAVENRIRRVEQALRRSEIATGSRVALLSHNSVEMVIVLWALWRIGAVAAPLNIRLPLPQLQEMVQHIGAFAVLVAPDFGKYQFPGIQIIALPLATNNAAPVNTINNAPDQTFVASAPATIVFTSGSTGTPKAAIHTLGNHYYSALGSNLNIPVNTGDRWLLSLPLFHVGGLAILFRTALGGGTVVLPGTGVDLAVTTTTPGLTHLSLVATQLYRLIKDRDGLAALKNLKAILLGGSAIPQPLISAALAAGLPIHTSYGATEMCSQVTTTPPNASPAQLKTSGKILKHRKLRIAADGEILLGGATLFLGYWQDGGLQPARRKDGWFASDDRGRIDEEGYLQVTGRRDNMFISGGENIQPEEIEAVMQQHPAVLRALVVAVQDIEFGQRPVAFIDWHTTFPHGEADLRNFLALSLASYKIPEHFYTWQENTAASGIKPSRQYFMELAENIRKKKRRD